MWSHYFKFSSDNLRVCVCVSFGLNAQRKRRKKNWRTEKKKNSDKNVICVRRTKFTMRFVEIFEHIFWMFLGGSCCVVAWHVRCDRCFWKTIRLCAHTLTHHYADYIKPGVWQSKIDETPKRTTKIQSFTINFSPNRTISIIRRQRSTFLPSFILDNDCAHKWKFNTNCM